MLGTRPTLAAALVAWAVSGLEAASAEPRPEPPPEGAPDEAPREDEAPGEPTAAAEAPSSAEPSEPGEATPPQAPVVRGKKKRSPSGPPTWAWGGEAGASFGVGALTGQGIVRDAGGLAETEVGATGRLTYGWWRLEIPLAARHRQMLASALDETRGTAGAELRLRTGPSFRLTLEAEIGATRRPDWPDPYQPRADGTLATTNRWSYWQRRTGAQIAAIPLRHEHVRLKYRYTLTDYRDDPNFDPVGRPTHIPPGDNGEHRAQLVVRHHGEGWKAGAGAEAFMRDYYFFFARDAGSGKTHAGAGGAPPNPLASRRGLEPSVGGEVDLGGERLTLEAEYGFEIVDDPFAGYYSFTGHHPALGISFTSPQKKLRASLKGELQWRTYGDGSYAEGPAHPPLDEAARRFDHRADLGARVQVAVTNGFSLFAEGDWLWRKTNFPDYEPGVFPEGAPYAIDWDWSHFRGLGGVAWRI